VKSDLDTMSFSIDSRYARKLKFLIDTGAEISIIRSSSLTPGVNYQFHEGVDIKGISNTVNAAAPSNKGASSCITDGLKNNFLNGTKSCCVQTKELRRLILRICVAERTKCFLGILCYVSFFVVSDFKDDFLYLLC